MNELALELSEQEYQLWKRHPVSQMFFQWVEDKLDDYRSGAAGYVESGPLDPVLLAEFKHRIAFCRELKQLRVSDIRYFYEIQKAQAKDEGSGEPISRPQDGSEPQR